MRKVRKILGFTITEVLLAVGIIAILAGVAFIGVSAYQRSLVKLEDDGFAREIFVAAQNHLTMVKSQGYLGRKDFGTKERPILDSDNNPIAGTGDGVYYFVINVVAKDEHGNEKILSNGTLSAEDDDSVLNLILPAASVDEMARLQGSYIIRYHKDSGQILDVFFWKDEGRFSYRPVDEANFLLDYAKFLEISRNNPEGLKNYGDKKSVIGWYGGDVTGLKSADRTLEPPAVLIQNEEKLTVTVTDVNAAAEGYRLKLIVRGVQSKRERTVVIVGTDVDDRVSGSVGGPYTVTLDDITAAGLRFHELKDNLNQNFYPGEDITVQAVASNTEVLSNVAYSAEQQTNSLFGKNTDPAAGKAMIDYIRHLENLDPEVSMVNNSAYGGENCPVYNTAQQTRQLRWQNFLAACGPGAQIHYGTSGATTAAGTYLPVNPTYVLTYDGQNNGIYGIRITSSGERTLKALGLFGQININGSAVQDLELVDFDIRDSTGSDVNAGALAGTLVGNVAVENVVAYNSDADQYSANAVTGTGSVGGLIGSAGGACSITYCAAAVKVSGGSSVGGLVGSANGTTVIIGCHSGGRTTDGKYTDFNVSGSASVGGLVGKFAGTGIYYSYSTCSAVGTGGTAGVGGLVGEASGSGSITSCYATGLVSAASGGTKGAFAGTLADTVTAANCLYYEIINQNADGKTYLGAVNSAAHSGITALDASTAVYSAFTAGEWNSIINDSDTAAAAVYDTALLKYYKGSYPLRTAKELGASVATDDFVTAHYGDWPAPESFVINVK